MYKVIVTTANGKTSFYKTKRSDDILFGQTGFSQFYYGEKGIITGTETDKRISNLEKQYEKIPVADMVGAKVEYFPMDGRTKRAKSLPWFSVDCLID